MKTNVGFILDSSGSMDVVREAVVKAFNANVVAVREGALREKQVTTASFWTFGERPEYGYSTSIKEKFFLRAVNALQPISLYDYRPHGNTPLFDAVGHAIERFLALPDAKTSSFLLMIKTDGEENGSYNYNAVKLRTLMQKVNATDRWTIAFLLPPGAKQRFCQQFGIPEGNVREWDASTRGVEEAQRHTTASLGTYFAGRSAGQTATKAFYSDLSGVKPTQVKRALDDIASEVKIWTVPAEIGITEFVEKKTRKPYRKGSAFYQLTKPELIQENKELLVMEKGKAAVYAGEDARAVLGIPDGRVKIKPGNHGAWEVFVQSTSSNRKLVRGSRLVVRA